jgi:hypothetical protein
MVFSLGMKAVISNDSEACPHRNEGQAYRNSAKKTPETVLADVDGPDGTIVMPCIRICLVSE